MADVVADNNSKDLAKNLIKDALSKIPHSPKSQPDSFLIRTGKGLSGVIKPWKHKEPYLYGQNGKVHRKDEIKRQLFGN